MNGEIRKGAVAATLRQVAGWGLEWPNEGHEDCSRQLNEIADAVEAMADDDPCCPLCEEVLCDEGCPLVGIRIYERRTL